MRASSPPPKSLGTGRCVISGLRFARSPVHPRLGPDPRRSLRRRGAYETVTVAPATNDGSSRATTIQLRLQSESRSPADGCASDHRRVGAHPLSPALVVAE